MRSLVAAIVNVLVVGVRGQSKNCLGILWVSLSGGPITGESVFPVLLELLP